VGFLDAANGAGAIYDPTRPSPKLSAGALRSEAQAQPGEATIEHAVVFTKIEQF
jgi:hypothetical protein